MTRTKRCVLLVLFGIAYSVSANAGVVFIDFEVNAVVGPLAGTQASGTFGYDDDIAPTGGGIVNATDLLVHLDFTWDGVTYDESTANTGWMTFDGLGNLTNAVFGGNCGPGTCSYASWLLSYGTAQFIEGTTAGPVTFSAPYTAAATPEPVTFTLLSVGLLGFGIIRRCRESGR